MSHNVSGNQFCSIIMFVIRKGYLAVLILTLTQGLGFATVHQENEKTKDSIRVAASYLLLPWIEGFEWLANSPESPDKAEVRALIRAAESGEPWALKILEVLHKNQSKSQEAYIKHSEMYDEYSLAKYNENIDILDRRCITGSEQRTSDISGECIKLNPTDYNVLATHKSRDDQIKNNPAQVTSEGSSAFTTVEMLTINFFLIVGVVLFGCTVCDFVERKKPEYSCATVNTLAKFSLYTGVLSLLKTETSSEKMTAIHGIRSLCCWSVVYGHRYIVTPIVLDQRLNVLDLLKLTISTHGLFLKMKLQAVDSFCVIGGFLTAYVFIKSQNSRPKSNWLTMFIRRYFRIAPCVAVVTLVTVAFAHRWGDGPLWEDIATKSVDACLQNWWVNLLFLQNIVAADRMCLAFTWYLALDMQLFWLSPFILYPLHRWPKFGLSILSFFLVASLLTPPIVLAVNGYFNGLIRFDRDFPTLLGNFGWYYVPTYNRAFPHLLGILVGYDVATKRRCLTQASVALIWTFIGSLAIFYTWGTHHVCSTSFAYDLTLQIVMSILLRPVWSTIIAWIMYACTQGYGGLATWFLSLRIFLPISGLSFSIYMVHMVIQTVTISSSQSPTPFSNFDLLTGHLGDLVLSIPVALLLNLFIERPVMVATNILLPNRRSQLESDSLSVEQREDSELKMNEQ